MVATAQAMLSRHNYMEANVLEKKEEEVVMMLVERHQNCIRCLMEMLFVLSDQLLFQE